MVVQGNRTPPAEGWGTLADRIFAWATGWAPFFGLLLTLAVVAIAFAALRDARRARMQAHLRELMPEVHAWQNRTSQFLGELRRVWGDRDRLLREIDGAWGLIVELEQIERNAAGLPMPLLTQMGLAWHALNDLAAFDASGTLDELRCLTRRVNLEVHNTGRVIAGLLA